jgi:hypothetical protein
MTRRMIFVCLALSMLLPIAAIAEHTRYWRQTDFSDFTKGTAKGVAIRSDGVLTPAPKFDSFSDPNLAYLWALRSDSHGHLYAAGGSTAKVLRFDDAGKSTVVFDSPELSAQSIVFDSKDNLYVGTSPDGKVYQVTADGKKNMFFDPKAKYIWALAIDKSGDLFVATGDSGKVFVVGPDGKGELFYQSQERHARSLAFDPKGNLLIGTAPGGLILRVPIEKQASGVPKAGAPFVVYETNKQEVTSLLADADGNIYASSIGEKISTPRLPPILPAQPAQGGATIVLGGSSSAIISQGTANAAAAANQAIFSGAATGGSEVVKVSTDGSPETLWSSRDDVVFALGMSPGGKLLLGTGDGGELIEIESDQVYSTIAKTASSQVTGFSSGPDGTIYVATANPGKIFSLGPGYATDGSFESQPFDAKIFTHWGRLTWWGDNGATQGKVHLYLRCGNTSTPEENWSSWAGPYDDASGAATDCPASRFAQWKAVFASNGQSDPPNLSWVSLAYQPKNVAPVIDDIVLQNPGIRVAGFPAAGGPGNAMPVQLRMPHGPGAAASAASSEAEASAVEKTDVPPQGFQQKGYQSVLWSAHDDNDDDLTFTIYFRGEGDHNWRLLKDKIRDRFYSWDTSTMPDGAYYLKVVASDAPSNPADQALWSERQSDRFEIANTPPRIENLRAGSGLLNTKASFDAVSSSGPIARAQYSIDAGDWEIVFPTGLLSDAPKESYFMNLPGLPPGEHMLSVRVADRFGNTAAAKTTFVVQSHNPQ